MATISQITSCMVFYEMKILGEMKQKDYISVQKMILSDIFHVVALVYHINFS